MKPSYTPLILVIISLCTFLFSSWFYISLVLIVLSGSYLIWNYHKLLQCCSQQQAWITAQKNLPVDDDLQEVISSLYELQNIIALAGQGNLDTEIDTSQHSELTHQLAVDTQYMLKNLRSLLKEVQNSGILVMTSLTDMNANTWELETTTTEQAKSNKEMNNQTKDIELTTQTLIKTMEIVSDISNKTVNDVINSQDQLETMQKTMNHMSHSTTVIMDKLFHIDQQSQQITRIVNTMTKIASQANLLSLNAAMEAEKAKEHGRGFSVVATEIRRLADQTAVATLDISKMVQTMQSAVTEGASEIKQFSQEVEQTVTHVDQLGQHLAKVIEQSKTLTPQFFQLNQGISSQANAANSINFTITQLDKATTQMAQALKKSNHTLEQLKNAAQGLQKGVSQFKVKHG